MNYFVTLRCSWSGDQQRRISLYEMTDKYMSVKKQKKTKNATAPKKAETKATNKPWKERRFFYEALIFIFSFLLFANAVLNNYNLDDELVTRNHRLTSKGIAGIGEIFTSPYYQDESGYSYEYRPVVLTTFAIEHDIFGDNPHWSHFWNVILYSLACVLLYRVLGVLFRNYSPLMALGVTLLFVAHPAHTEVVCSIKNRDEILGLIFSVAALDYALKAVRGKLWTLLPVLGFFLLALLSKLTFAPFAIIIPLAVFLFEEFDLKIMLLLIIALLIPVTILSPIGDTMVKVYILLAGLGGGLLGYSIKYFPRVKGQLNGLRARLAFRQFEWNTKGGEILSLRSLFTDMGAPFAQINVKRVAIYIILLILYTCGAYYSLYSLQLMVSLILIASLFEKGANNNWPLYLVIYVIICVRIYLTGAYFHHVSLEFFTTLVAFYFFYAGRRFILPNLIGLIAICWLYFLRLGFLGGVVVPFLSFFTMYLMRFRFAWVIFLATFPIHIVTDCIDENFQLQAFLTYLIVNGLIFIFILSVHFKKFHFGIARLFLVAILIGTLAINWQHQRDILTVNVALENINNVKVKISPKTENRPIQYVENVVDFKTPRDLRAGTAAEVLLHYLGKTILPYPLSYYYGYSFIKPMKVTDTMPLISIVIHLLLLAMGLFFYRKNKLIFFGIFLYLIPIAIYSNCIFPVPGMVADRFMLIPSLGWLIVLVSALVSIFKIEIEQTVENTLSTGSKAAGLIFAGVLCLYSAMTFSRNQDWKDHLTLFEHDIKYVNESAQAHNLLGLRLMKNSYDENPPPATQIEYRKEAAAHFRKAIEIYPPFFNATYDLGRVFQILGEPDSAIKYFTKALVLDSSFTPIAFAVGDMLMQQNKFREAVPYYEKYIQYFPQDYSGYDRLNRALLMDKDVLGSIDLMRKALQEMPKNATPCVVLARDYHNINAKDSTRYWLDRALEINPGDQDAKGLLQSMGMK
jgi:hypothetical protein